MLSRSLQRQICHVRVNGMSTELPIAEIRKIVSSLPGLFDYRMLEQGDSMTVHARFEDAKTANISKEWFIEYAKTHEMNITAKFAGDDNENFSDFILFGDDQREHVVMIKIEDTRIGKLKSMLNEKFGKVISIGRGERNMSNRPYYVLFEKVEDAKKCIAASDSLLEALPLPADVPSGKMGYITNSGSLFNGTISRNRVISSTIREESYGRHQELYDEVGKVLGETSKHVLFKQVVNHSNGEKMQMFCSSDAMSKIITEKLNIYGSPYFTYFHTAF